MSLTAVPRPPLSPLNRFCGKNALPIVQAHGVGRGQVVLPAVAVQRDGLERATL